jgi:photosystem II stability/assembly factor-like uncharacterized protein
MARCAKLFICFFLTILSFNQFLVVCDGTIAAQESSWKMIGPGDADQAKNLSVMDDGTVFLGTDIGGIYRSTNYGEYWEPSNAGIKNYNITTPVIQARNNPNILYVGTRGGFYKSSDYGNSWQNIRQGLRPVANYSLSGIIGSIGIDPFNPNVLYLGYDYRPDEEGTAIVSYLYKSNDYGESWQIVGALDAPAGILNIVCPSGVKNLVFIATSNGIYRSSDGGTNWTKIFNKPTRTILVSPSASRIVASCGQDGVHVSYDNGSTWSSISKGLTFNYNISMPDTYTVLAAPTGESQTLYVVNTTWAGYGGVFRSMDGGQNWSYVTSSLPQSWLSTSKHVNTIAIDPNNPMRIYIGSSRYVYRSDDGGTTWSQLISKPIDGEWVHTGINVFGHTRVVAVDPTNQNVILIGTTDHGMVRSSNNGVSWMLPTLGMKYKDSVWDIVFCPNQPNRVYAISLSVSRKFCLAVSEDKGYTWNTLSSNLDENVPLYKILVNPNDYTKILVCGNDGVFKSSDSGLTWTKLDGLPCSTVWTIAFHPNDPTVVYAATSCGLYKGSTLNSGWNKLISVNAPVRSLLISKTDPNIILIGIENSSMNKGGIYRSSDGGSTWMRVLTAERWVSGIVQSTADNMIYAATNDDNFHDESAGSGVFKSNDGGRCWIAVNEGLPVFRSFNINEDAFGRVFLSANGSGAYLLQHFINYTLNPLAPKGLTIH